MDLNIINALALLIVAVFGLWKVIVLIFGKRMVADSKQLAFILQIGLFLYTINNLTGNKVHPIVVTIGLLIFWGILRYFGGVGYTIYSDNQKNLIKSIEEGLRELEGATSFEQVKEDKKITFVMPDTKKSIKLILLEPTFSKRVTHEIVFKKWPNVESRREILYLIKNSLQEDEGGRMGKLPLALLSIMAIGFFLFSLGMTATSVMKPETAAALEEPPSKAYIIETQRYSQTTQEVLVLHEELKKARISRRYNMKPEDVREGAEIILYYPPKTNQHREDDNLNPNQYEGRQIFIGYNTVDLFVPNAEIGNRSYIHKMLWKFYQIYDKSQGSYYYIFSGNTNQWKAEIDAILKSNGVAVKED